MTNELIQSSQDQVDLIKSQIAPEATKVLSKFEELLKLNVNDKVEKKKSGNTDLTYLSWAFAVAEMEKAYPEWEYNILEFNGLPYQFDPNTGYLVWTEIKAGGKTKRMWLPVMDGANKAMKDKPYEYTTKFGKKTVEAVSMFDINKTIMRCLVKNIAMFGIGLYIYAGEDLPENQPESQPKNKSGLSPDGALANADAMKEVLNDKNEQDFAGLKAMIENCGGLEELQQIWTSKENAKIINSLKKWRPELYDKLVEAKDFMKKELKTNEIVNSINSGTVGILTKELGSAIDPEHKGE